MCVVQCVWSSGVARSTAVALYVALAVFSDEAIFGKQWTCHCCQCGAILGVGRSHGHSISRKKVVFAHCVSVWVWVGV